MRWMFLVLVSVLACTSLWAEPQEIKVSEEDRFTVRDTEGIRAEVVPVPAGGIVGGAGQAGQGKRGARSQGRCRSCRKTGMGL